MPQNIIRKEGAQFLLHSCDVAVTNNHPFVFLYVNVLNLSSHR